MNTWIIYTVITIIYIVILVSYFLHRSRSHEEELREFLELAQNQLESHKKQTSTQANQKVAQALSVVKKVQQAARAFEDQAQKEYTAIIDEAKTEKRELLANAKAEIEQLFKTADRDLQTYKQERYQEIEQNLVKLVVAVTEKVVETTLNPRQHQEIIKKALEEIKQNKARS